MQVFRRECPLVCPGITRGLIRWHIQICKPPREIGNTTVCRRPPGENLSTTCLVLQGMSRRGRSNQPLRLIVESATLLAVSACVGPPYGVGPPSPAECIAGWNNPGNRESQAAVAAMGFPRAYVAGWPTKAGDHCSATFFTRRGEPWVMFVLWLDAPEPRAQFARNVGGSRYGQGELGAERPFPPNAEVKGDGTLSQTMGASSHARRASGRVPLVTDAHVGGKICGGRRI
jgi:hypothetical protein